MNLKKGFDMKKHNLKKGKKERYYLSFALNLIINNINNQ